MEGPPPAAGVRLPWSELPPRIPAMLSEWLQSNIAEVEMQRGGFSPGVAARVRSDTGRRVFVKAVGPELNPDSPAMHRREGEIVAALPSEMPVPRLLWEYDEGGEDGWVMLVFEDVEGRQPALPWRRDELDRVVHMLISLSDLLTPTPIEAPTAAQAFTEQIRGWRDLHDEPPTGLDRWSLLHLDVLADLEAGASAAVEGNTLLHFDARADNMLLTAERVVLVDWPHACVGAPWVDMVAFAPSVAMQGGPAPDDLLMRHPAARRADPEAITAVVAWLAGLFTSRALQPPPPGLPTLRAFQAAQALEARRWLARRMGWAEE